MSGVLHRLARAGEIDWLSYYFAELVARQARSPVDDLPGICAALVSEANLQGDVCVRLDDFAAAPWLRSPYADTSQLAALLDNADWKERLKACPGVGAPGEIAPLVLEHERLYLNRYWRYEFHVAEKILALLQQRANFDPAALTQHAGQLFSGADRVDPDQLQAIERAANSPFCVISGGPGTGKTTTVVRILVTLIALQPDLRIGLAAPTGRAAARMLESIRDGAERLDIDPALVASLPTAAGTIHRLLGYRRGRYDYDREHRLALDCVVIDEASMVDLELMYRLLEALPDEARLILLGDRDQLASVAAGNVLGDITGHGYAPDQVSSRVAPSVVLLQHSYRFDSGGGIGRLAAQVNLGNSDAAFALLEAGGAEVGWHQPAQDELLPIALDFILEAFQAVFDASELGAALDAYAATRVLCATNHGPLGVDALNQLISTRLLARNRLPDSAHYHGLPIMIRRNRHDLGIYNGDTGILWRDDDGLRACFRDAQDGIRSIALNRLPDFAPAWTSTVHKSQGAEFESVMLILPAADDSEALSRELVYTAITRARKRFLLHGSRGVTGAAIARLSRRHSGLAERLGWPVTADPGIRG